MSARSFVRAPLIRGALTLTCACTVGCSSGHVQLAPLPPDDAPLEQRAAFYDDHKPLEVRVSTLPQGGMTSYGPFMLLTDGVRVTEPEDLLQHVPPSSPTSKAALRALQKKDERFWWGAAAGAVYTVGFGTMLSAFPVAFALERNGTSADETLTISMALTLGGGAVALAGLFPMLQSFAAAGEAVVETETALLFYDQDLKRQLRLPRDAVAAKELPQPIRADPALLTPDG